MSTTSTASTTIDRTERGLTISGTRTTVYRVYECVQDGWPRKLIREWLGLTDEQLAAALDYVTAHTEQVAQEYEEVVRQAAQTREYWEDRNRARLAKLAEKPRSPEEQALRKRLHARSQDATRS